MLCQEAFSIGGNNDNASRGEKEKRDSYRDHLASEWCRQEPKVSFLWCQCEKREFLSQREKRENLALSQRGPPIVSLFHFYHSRGSIKLLWDQRLLFPVLPHPPLLLLLPIPPLLLLLLRISIACLDPSSF